MLSLWERQYSNVLSALFSLRHGLVWVLPGVIGSVLASSTYMYNGLSNSGGVEMFLHVLHVQLLE